MLYIGLTQATIQKMPLEQGNITISSTAKVVQQISVYGTPNFTMQGANKSIFDLVFDSIENNQLSDFKLFCVPYIAQRIWVKLTNGTQPELIIYEGWAFCQLSDLAVDYNFSKNSFKLTIYQL